MYNLRCKVREPYIPCLDLVLLISELCREQLWEDLGSYLNAGNQMCSKSMKD